jgi:hypothetical protein
VSSRRIRLPQVATAGEDRDTRTVRPRPAWAEVAAIDSRHSHTSMPARAGPVIVLDEGMSYGC